MRFSNASGLWAKLGHLWCRFAHDDILWPVQGKYRCRRCFRTHDIPWEKSQEVEKSTELMVEMRERNAFY
jgi:hypothetical protein